jgi:tetratricopeptide (TPR) repeat protein
MSMNIDKFQAAPSPAKARAFSAIFIATLVILPLLVIEGAVRLLGWESPHDPYISFGRTTSFFSDFKEDGTAYKVVNGRDLYREREITFSRDKPKGAVRIFFVGGSASAGWPHPDGETYTDYLESALYRAFPDREIEILNISAHAYAAYRVRLIFDEILAFQPDLVVIYSGNNEFVEQRRYAVADNWYDPVARIANLSTAYRLLRGSPAFSSLFPTNSLSAETRGGIAMEQWSKIEGRPATLRTDAAQFQKVKEHYAFSIRSMLQGARDFGIPAVLLTVPTNTRNWQPNVSTERVEGERAITWRKNYRAGRAALIRAKNEQAVDWLQKALSVDPGHAATHYHLARALEVSGRLAEANASYDRARDLDANPFRALSAFNKILRGFASEFDHVNLVDADQLFREASAPHAPGFNVFLDYVHPTRRGNLILAKAVFDSILESGILGTKEAKFEYTPETGDDGTVYDEATDQDLQRILLILAMMMHQHETAVAIAERILANPVGLEAFDEEEARTVTQARILFGKLVALERVDLLTGSVTKDEKARLNTELDALYKETFGNYLEYQRQRGK